MLLCGVGPREFNSNQSVLKNPPAKFFNMKRSRLSGLAGFSLYKASATASLLNLWTGCWNIIGEHKPDFLFLQQFLQQLPSQVRVALANTAITDLPCKVWSQGQVSIAVGNALSRPQASVKQLLFIQTPSPAPV